MIIFVYGELCWEADLGNMFFKNTDDNMIMAMINKQSCYIVRFVCWPYEIKINQICEDGGFLGVYMC